MVAHLQKIIFFLLLIPLAYAQHGDSIKVTQLIDSAKHYRSFNTNKAEKLYFDALNLSKTTNYYKGIYNSFSGLSVFYNRLGNTKESLNYCFKALNIALDNNDTARIGKSYFNIGVVYMRTSDYNNALKHFNLGLKYLQEANNNRVIIKTHQNIAVIFDELDFQDSVLTHTLKALNLAKETKDTTYIISNAFNLGALYLNKEQYDLGLKEINYSKKIVNQIKNSGYKDKVYSAILLSLSGYYVSQKKYTESLNTLLESLHICKDIKYIIGEAESNLKLGETYLLLKNYNKAESYFNSTLKLSKKINNKNLENLTYHNLAELYKQTKQYKKATTNAEKYITLNDSLKSIKNTKLLSYYSSQIDNTENKYKIASQQLKIENQERKLLKKNILIITLIGITFIVFLSLLYYFQKKDLAVKDAHNKNLKQKHKQLLDANAKVIKSSKRESLLLDSITHELRTPLSTIINTISLISNEKKITTNFINILKFSSDYLLNYINNIITIKMINNDVDYELLEQPFNFRHFIDYIFNEKINSFNGNKIIKNIDPTIPKIVIADKLIVSQILMNLLNNANKFTENGTITITAKAKQKTKTSIFIKFKIEDTGIGIKPEDKENIFNLFNIGSNTPVNSSKSTGIGLAVVKENLNLYNSNITLKTKENQGTDFEFTIPFGYTEKQLTSNNVNLKKPSVNKKSISILLVDDNVVNLKITQKVILNEGLKCDIAKNGKEAIKKAKQKDYTIILMDIMMPELDGFETSKQIKGFNKTSKIIALTSLLIEQHKNDFIKSGIIKAISKPVDKNKLIDTIIKCTF